MKIIENTIESLPMAQMRERIAELEAEVKESHYVISQQPSIVKLEDKLEEAKQLLWRWQAASYYPKVRRPPLEETKRFLTKLDRG